MNEPVSVPDSERLGPLGRWVARRVLATLVGPQGSDGRRVLDLSKFGIEVADPLCCERIFGVLRAFFSGFEAELLAAVRAERASSELMALYAPFSHEGSAMGVAVRSLLRLASLGTTLERFERRIAPASDPFVLLRYVGLGFALGFRLGDRAERVDGAASLLRERRLRHLVHDGYGFQRGFFALRGGAGAARARSDRRTLGALRGLRGFARASAFNGLGRSLWFFHMDRPDEALRWARSLGDDAPAVTGGFGLAAAFTWIDELARAYGVADGLDGAERRHFEKGIRIALYCRHENDSAQLVRWLAKLPPALRARADRDLAQAVEVGRATSSSDEFIEEFHARCLEAGSS